jgi:hypothetical protein
MRGRVPPAFVVGIATCALTAPQAAAVVDAGSTQQRPCRAQGSKTVTRSSTGRIYSERGTKKLYRRKEQGVRFFGCLYSTGRPYVLAFWPDGGADLGYPHAYEFRIAGRFAAFAVMEGSDSGPDGGMVVRRDLKTGAWRRDRHPALMPDDPHDNPFVAGELDYRPSDLVVSPSGALAWIVSSSYHDDPNGCRDLSPCRVLKTDRDGRAVLDEGGGVRATSLARNGSTVTWISNSQSRSATLR